METKRQVPKLLRTVLAVDAYLTNVFVRSVKSFVPLTRLKKNYKLLKISCDSLIWLMTILIFIWILNNKDLYQMQVNLIIGLLIDIFLVSLLKAIARRRQPEADNRSIVDSDKYSFPSGHASHAAFIVYFFFHVWPISFIYILPLMAWSFFICVSSLLMKKHYILDVLVGVLLGIIEGIFVGYIYLEQDTCVSLVSWIL